MAFKCRYELLAAATRFDIPCRTWLGPPEVVLCALSKLNPQMTHTRSLVDVGEERTVVVVKDKEPRYRRQAALSASDIGLFRAILSTQEIDGGEDGALACLIRTNEGDEIFVHIEGLLRGKASELFQLHLDQTHAYYPLALPRITQPLRACGQPTWGV